MEITIVEQFKRWLIEDGKAESTVQSYVNDVQKFNEYLQIKHFDLDVLMNRFYFTSYLKHLKKEQAKMNTINKKITLLKVYNDWLFQNSMVEEVFVRIKKIKFELQLDDVVFF